MKDTAQIGHRITVDQTAQSLPPLARVRAQRGVHRGRMVSGLAGQTDQWVASTPPTNGAGMALSRLGDARRTGLTEKGIAPARKAAAATFGAVTAATVVRPYLLLADASVASNFALLQRLGVTHILNLTCEVDNALPGRFIYKTIRARDNLAQQLRGHFAEIVDFIEDVRRRAGAKVLVHCSEGVSRSTTAVLAWLMRAEGKQLGDAFDELKALRPVTEPNPSFLQQLRQYEQDLQLPKRTTRKLTMLDEGGEVAVEPAYLAQARSLVSRAATDGVQAVADADVGDFVTAFADLDPARRQDAIVRLVTAVFHAFGGQMPRDQVARRVLSRLIAALAASGTVPTWALGEALRLLPDSDAWDELDLPLRDLFLEQLRQELGLAPR